MRAQPKHEPTREEIAAECAKIREGWGERVHWQRLGFEDGKPVLTVPGAKMTQGDR